MAPSRDRTFLSRSPEATEELAERLGRGLPRGALLALDGELGAGKTAFVRGLARGLGIEEPISSPTFTLMHRYRGARTLDHFDAWMEGRERAFLADGGAELLGTEDVTVVEWAGSVAEWLPEIRLEVHLAHLRPEERRLTFAVRGAGPGTEALEAALERLEAPPGATELTAGASDDLEAPDPDPGRERG